MKVDTTNTVENNLKPLTLKRTLKSLTNLTLTKSRNANELNTFRRNMINMERRIRYRRRIRNRCREWDAGQCEDNLKTLIDF